MKSGIYYFSGTGNSLSVAGKISAGLKECGLFPIPRVMKEEKDVQGEVIGIVCPIYMHNMPLIVAEFIGRIKRADYLFFVFSGAGGMGDGDKVVRKFFRKKGLTLSALFNVPMPSNYTPYGCLPPERQKLLLEAVDGKVGEIIRIVRERKTHFDTSSSGFFKSYIHPGLLYKIAYPHIRTFDKIFSVDENCNGCGMCSQVCPVGNIIMKDNRPQWTKNCQQCYACLQWCPKKAIQAGAKTAAIDRYHHPDVSVKEIISASPSS